MPGLLVTVAGFPSAGGLPQHFHDRPVIATTFRGAFASLMRGRTYWLPASTAVVEPQGERHENAFVEGGAEVLVLQPDPSHEPTVRPLARLLAAPNELSHAALAPLAFRLAREVLSDDDVAPLAVQALALELLATAGRLTCTEQARIAPWLNRVRERLHDNPASPPRLEDLADLAGVHMGHLTRAFRRAFGCSIGDYARTVRLSRAAERLREDDVTVAVVAAEFGFADQSHFTRLFHRRFGCTPSNYRSMHDRTRRSF